MRIVGCRRQCPPTRTKSIFDSRNRCRTRSSRSLRLPLPRDSGLSGAGRARMWLPKAIIAVIHRDVVGGNGPGAFRPDRTARLAEIVEHPKSDDKTWARARADFERRLLQIPKILVCTLPPMCVGISRPLCGNSKRCSGRLWTGFRTLLRTTLGFLHILGPKASAIRQALHI